MLNDVATCWYVYVTKYEFLLNNEKGQEKVNWAKGLEYTDVCKMYRNVNDTEDQISSVF